MAGESTRVNCHKCKHFFLTWKPSYPYGCRAFKMESKLIPSRHVLMESRQECLYFEEKKTPQSRSEDNKYI